MWSSVRRRWAAAAGVERVAEGVWVLRGGVLRVLNAYLLEDAGGGVTLFDAGAAGMAAALRRAAEPLGGINRVVLGHADADHRGGAPALGVPVWCHAAEREAAEAPGTVRPYFDPAALAPPARAVVPRLLRVWDGGPVGIAGTVGEGDEISGFRVVELPGHAPGLVGLWREPDRLALTSDAFYGVDVQTGRRVPPRLTHAFTWDAERARASLRKLAALEPAAAWPGHYGPVRGDVRAELERAAAA